MRQRALPDSGLIRSAVIGAFLAVAGAPPVSGQGDASPPVIDTVEVVDVVLVNVEVWVTDRKGEPIHGLTAADLEVLEDGRPVEITHFAEIRPEFPRTETGLLAEEEPAAAPAQAPAAASAAREAPTAGHASHLVVYFDQLHLSTTSARRFAADLKDFLAEGQVPPSRVAILSQGFDLDIVAPFGSTTEQLVAAVENLGDDVAVAGGQLEARLAVSRMQENWEYAKNLPRPCRAMVNLTKSEVGARVAELSQHFRLTLNNLNATARFLAGLPGPKTLVLVSDSLELRPGEELLRFARNVCPQERELGELTLLGEATLLETALVDFALGANTNRVTFYPIQASGLISSSTMGAENRAFDQVAMQGVESNLRRVQQGGLLSLARETGGVATLNRNRFRQPLERIARDMESYYSLAYVPPRPGSGESHSIKVRVKRPGARVRHRLGYRDKSAAEVRDERLDGAIAFGLMDNPLAMRLAAGQVEDDGEGHIVLPLHLLIPRDSIAFVGRAAGELAQVEVVVRARNASTGKQLEHSDVLGVGPPEDGTELVALKVTLTLPVGVYVLGVSARDVATGLTSFVSTTLALQPPAETVEPASSATRGGLGR